MQIPTSVVLLILLVIASTYIAFDELVIHDTNNDRSNKKSKESQFDEKNDVTYLQCSQINNSTPNYKQQLSIPNPRYQTGSWIANTWVPPLGWRILSVTELQQIWNDKSILFVGDSTSRRMALTLYELLNKTSNDNNDSINYRQISIGALDEKRENSDSKRNNLKEQLHQQSIHVPWIDLSKRNVIDTNRYDVTERCNRFPNETSKNTICRDMPHHEHSIALKNNKTNDLVKKYTSTTKTFTIKSKTCLGDVEDFFITEATADGKGFVRNVDIIVVAVGVWEELRTEECNISRRHRDDKTLIRDVVEAVAQFQSINCTIVFRTSGYHVDGGQENGTFISNLNENLMDSIDEYNDLYEKKHGHLSHVTYFNWGTAVLPRSFGTNRIDGGHVAHYGAEPRLVAVEMLTNLLMDRGVLEYN